MIAWISSQWRRYQRHIDLTVLWPEIRRRAATLHDARCAFRIHCLHDDAWMRDFDYVQLERFVGELE